MELLAMVFGFFLFLESVICGNTRCLKGYYFFESKCEHCNIKPPSDSHKNTHYFYNKLCGIPCSRGFYGSSCSNTCSQYCYNRTCDRWTAKCTYGCVGGRYGDTCNNHCSRGCISGGCHKNGTCIHGCKSQNYYGSYCSKCPVNCVTCHSSSSCIQCKSGYYSKSCHLSCSKCIELDCDNNGICLQGCKPSWYGLKCDHKCPSNCANDRCKDGVCNGCKDGYRGYRCNMSCPSNCERCHQHEIKCTTCKVGRYGFLCGLSCPGCKDHLCDDQGNCTDGCKQSNYGPKCDNACSIYCKESNLISNRCLQESGQCIHGCKDDWYGSRCDERCDTRCLNMSCKLLKSGNVTCSHGCTEGWWGPDCRHQCPTNCQTCQNDTGICQLCTKDTYGNKCSLTCNEGCVEQNCDITGVCREGCVRGRMGDKCQFSTLWFLLPVCSATLLLTVIVWICVRGFEESTKNCTSTRETVLLEIEGKNPNCQFCTNKTGKISEDHPLLAAEAFMNLRSVNTRVLLCHFQDYVRKQTMTDELLRQFTRLPVNPVYPCCHGDLSQSVTKNRYENILPYDYNRVVLDWESTNLSSDYINASYIKGYDKVEAFIATQGPFSDVVDAFWTMIWQRDVRKIVMLTKCIEDKGIKCDQYWPSAGQAQMITPDIVVECQAEISKDSYVTRTFILSKGAMTRVIKQFHFTTWPDFGVPENVTSLFSLHAAVTTYNASSDGPVVVHCSAGVGRTGTYIALDYLIKQAKAEGVVDVYECVLRLRHQRMNLVQTEEQYLFLHHVLLQALDTLSDSGCISIQSVSLDVDKEESVM